MIFHDPGLIINYSIISDPPSPHPSWKKFREFFGVKFENREITKTP
jgi:hypothetical protein